MKHLLPRLILLLILALPILSASSCTRHAEPAAAASTAAASAKRHPLKGIIIDVLAGQSALMVKHEDIPGYMMGMTMMFKVDPATLKAARKDQAIAGTLVEREDGLWLEDVRPVR